MLLPKKKATDFLQKKERVKDGYSALLIDIPL
jgi:hypothetical protein